MTQITHDELQILNRILDSIPTDEQFTVVDVHQVSINKTHAASFGKIWENIKNDPNVIKQHKNITSYIISNGFAIQEYNKAVQEVLRLTRKGVMLWACSSVEIFYRHAAKKSTQDEVLSRIEFIMSIASPYGEFQVISEPIPDPKVLHANPLTEEGESAIREYMAKLDPKNKIIATYHKDRENEEVMQYLINEGFAINRHDIKSPGIILRQLTDKGRKLKELRTLNEFNKFEKKAATKAELQIRRIDQGYWLNFWIAVGTIVAALYASFQIMEFYEKHWFSTVYLAWYVLGVVCGGLITAVIIHQLNRKRIE